MALAICPACGAKFDSFRIYTVKEVADLLGVRVNTVRSWMWKGILQFRIRMKGKTRFDRIVDSVQLMSFLDERWPRVDPSSTSRVQLAWNKRSADMKHNVSKRTSKKAA